MLSAHLPQSGLEASAANICRLVMIPASELVPPISTQYLGVDEMIIKFPENAIIAVKIIKT